MNKSLIVTSMALSSSLCASQNHQIATKGAFRHHDQKGYSYSVLGMGWEYKLETDKGIGVYTRRFNSHSKDNYLGETEGGLFYRKEISDNIFLSPSFGSYFITHSMQQDDEKIFSINKTSGFFGLGIEFLPLTSLGIKFDAQIFKELSHSLSMTTLKEFYGKNYPQLMGFQGRMGINKRWTTGFFLEIEGYVGKSFKKCYKNFGFDTSLKWGF